MAAAVFVSLTRGSILRDLGKVKYYTLLSGPPARIIHNEVPFIYGIYLVYIWLMTLDP